MTDTATTSTPVQGSWILFTVILGSSLAFIDGTVVNVALPFLQDDRSASATGVQWVVRAYQQQGFRAAVSDAFIDGYRLVMLVSGPIALVGAEVAAVTVPGGKPIDCGVGEPAPELQSSGRDPLRRS